MEVICIHYTLCFLHQILKYRKRFVGQNWCKKNKKNGVKKIDVKQIWCKKVWWIDGVNLNLAK